LPVGKLKITQAIKKLKADVDMKFMKEFKRELAVMLRIRPHPNLVSFIGVCNEGGHLILVTEYCQGGTLFSLLHKNRTMALSSKQKKKIMTDVARGMIFLHENNTPVIHRDLKSLK
jgi:serine/threonine protein kinase